MSIRLILPSIALIAAIASAAIGQQQASPADAAKAFTLDGLAPTASPTATASAAPDATAPAATPTLAAPRLPESEAVATPVPATPVPATNAPATRAPAPTIRAVFTLDTPIQDLIADPAAKAVLDKDLPGMSDDENLDKFKMLSLRSLQPQTGGQLTEAMLAKVATDLDALGGAAGPTTMPTPLKAGNSKRNQDSSR